MTIDALRLQDLGAVGSIYSRSVASRRISDAPAATATAAAWYPPLTRDTGRHDDHPGHNDAGGSDDPRCARTRSYSVEGRSRGGHTSTSEVLAQPRLQPAAAPFRSGSIRRAGQRGNVLGPGVQGRRVDSLVTLRAQ